MQRADGAYLIVEEKVSGRAVLTQPGGHIEPFETPEAAAERETLEETGCVVTIRELLGVYRWTEPRTRRAFLRIMYVADFQDSNPDPVLDDGVLAAHWLSRDALLKERQRHRSPAVLRAIDDFSAGRRIEHDSLAALRSLPGNLSLVHAAAAPI